MVRTPIRRAKRKNCVSSPTSEDSVPRRPDPYHNGYLSYLTFSGLTFTLGPLIP